MYESADGKLYVAENNGTIDILQHDAIIKRPLSNDQMSSYLVEIRI